MLFRAEDLNNVPASLFSALLTFRDDELDGEMEDGFGSLLLARLQNRSDVVARHVLNKFSGASQADIDPNNEQAPSESELRAIVLRELNLLLDEASLYDETVFTEPYVSLREETEELSKQELQGHLSEIF